MSHSLSIDTKTSALLVMDFQHFVLDNFLPSQAADEVVASVTELLGAARDANIFVIHVAVGFRPGYPEVNTRNKVFSGLQESGLAAPGSFSVAIVDALKPLQWEPIVVKHRIGAFQGTDLEMLLRARRIETLILAGVTTAGVVLSTVRQAFDMDYELIVACDGCADADREVHDLLLSKVIPQHAVVVPSTELSRMLRGMPKAERRP